VGITAFDRSDRYPAVTALFNFRLSRLTLARTSARIRFYRIEGSGGETEIDASSARIGDELLIRIEFDITPTYGTLTINDEQVKPLNPLEIKALQYRFTPRKEGTHIIKGTFFYGNVAVSFEKEFFAIPAPRS